MAQTLEQLAPSIRGIDHVVIGPTAPTAIRPMGMWGGQFSSAHTEGFIVQKWLVAWASKFNCHFICCRTDGVVDLTDEEIAKIDAHYPRFLIPIVSSGIEQPLPK